MLNIAKQIYVAWSSNTHTLPDVDIAPMGAAVNEKNKVKKLKSRHSNTAEYDNIALPGFTLLESDGKTWGSGETEWRVIDPRGFISMITSANLTEILSITGITEGLIQEKCVWARNDNETKLSLIPVNSPSYQEAIDNTVLLDNKVKKTDIGYGDTVDLQNGMSGRYFGTVTLYGPVDYRYSYYGNSTAKVQTFARRQIIEVKKGFFLYGTDLKILQVTKPSPVPMTKADALEYLNDEIKKGSHFTSNPSDDGTNSWSTKSSIQYISESSNLRPTLSLVEITKTEAEQLYLECYKTGDKYKLVLENLGGEHFILDLPYAGSRSISTEFIPEPIVKIKPGDTEIVMGRGRQSFNNYGNRKFSKLDNFAKFYKIVKNVKSVTYV